MAKRSKNNASQTDFETIINENNDYDFNDDEILSLVPLLKIDQDTKKAVQLVEIDKTQMRYLVDLFYQTQDTRIEAQNRIRAINQGKDSAPNNTSTAILKWNLANVMIQEAELKKIIETAVQSCQIGRWLLAVNGIGPLIAASLIAYLDIDKAKHATGFHQYAGLNNNNRPWLGAAKSAEIVNKIMAGRKTPTEDDLYQVYAATGWPVDFLERSISYNRNGEEIEWTKENLIKTVSMIPYNKRLKLVVYKIGEQFVKISKRNNTLYGKLYKERKAIETAKNEAGEYADQAKHILASKKFSKSTEAYKAYSKGKLPKGHIDMRAKRWTVKIFLSHLFEEMYWEKNGVAPAPFYTIADTRLGIHTVVIEPEVPYTTSGEKFDNKMFVKIRGDINLEEKKKIVKVTKNSDGARTVEEES